MAHTPGPWKIGKHGSVVTDTPDDQMRITGEHADETIEWYGGHVVCETVTHANARLISAAPDLLEALKKCSDYLSIDVAADCRWCNGEGSWTKDDENPRMIPVQHNSDCPIEIASVAIAKAEGRA